MEHRPEDAHAELLVLGRRERPVHQRAEVVGRVPGLPGVLALDQLRRGREQLAVARAQVVEARPGQEVRALGADRVVGAERVGAEQPQMMPEQAVHADGRPCAEFGDDDDQAASAGSTGLASALRAAVPKARSSASRTVSWVNVENVV